MDMDSLFDRSDHEVLEISIKDDLEKISEFKIPQRENCWEEQTSAEVFFVKDWDKGCKLEDLQRDDPTSFRDYMEYLFDVKEDWNPPPWGTFLRFDWYMVGWNLLVMLTTQALNV